MATFTAWKKLKRGDPRRKKGYKYETTRGVVYQSGWLSGAVKKTARSSGRYVRIDPDGTLTIKQGYCWDGASGPTFDTANTMLGSLIHDALYQLFREKILDRYEYRSVADIILRRILIEQGMWRWRANFWVWAVLTFGRRSAGG